MSSVKQGIYLSTLSLFACSTQLYSAEHEHEQYEAHVHGEAALLIALDGSTLEIEFLSPAMNIVGFEHQPANEAQTRAVETAIATLKQPELLFNLPSAAKCSVESIETASPLADHNEHKHEHAKEVSNAHEEQAHSDFTGHYHFQCADTTQLNKIEIEIFKHFPGTEMIEVQSISKRGQHKIDLTPDRNILDI